MDTQWKVTCRHWFSILAGCVSLYNRAVLQTSVNLKVVNDDVLMLSAQMLYILLPACAFMHGLCAVCKE